MRRAPWWLLMVAALAAFRLGHCAADAVARRDCPADTAAWFYGDGPTRRES